MLMPIITEVHCRAQLPTFLYPLQGAIYITKHRVLYNRVGGNLGQYILYAIPTLLLIYVGYTPLCLGPVLFSSCKSAGCRLCCVACCTSDANICHAIAVQRLAGAA